MCKEMKTCSIKWFGKIPSKWKIVKVKQLFNIGRGRVIAQTELDDKGLYPVYSSQTKNNGCLGYINTYDFDKKQLTWTTDGANAGTVFLREGKYNCTNICGTLLPKNEENNIVYLKYILEYTAIFHKRADTNGFKIMNNEMAEISILLPNKVEQDKIANYLDKKVSQINDIISKQKKLIEKYKAYKESLITETVTKGLNKNVPMKDSGIGWIGEIPNHWGICKLNNVVSFFNGDRGKNYPNENEYVIEGIPFINAGNLENGRISFNNMKYISLSKYDSMGGAKIQVNDIVYCLRGTIGKNAFVTELDKATVASSLMVIRADKIFARFLFYILNSNIEKIQSKFSENGTAQPNLSAQSVGNYITILPNKKEQMEIADFLDKKCNTIDFTISKKEQLIEKLESYKKSLIYECVTGKREVN